MSRTATLLSLALSLGTAAVLTAAPAAAAPPAGPTTPSTEAGSTTSATSESSVRPDGARTVTLYSGPVRVQRGAEWLPVDLTLQTGPDGVVRPVAAPHDLRLTPTGPSVRYAEGGSAAVVWPAPLPTPQLDGPKATYRQVRPGYDLEVEATRAGFVASVRKDGTPTGPAPDLKLTGNAEALPDASGSLTEAESAVSRVVAAAPVTTDAPVPFDTTAQTTVRNTDTSGDPDLRLGSYDGKEAARSYLTFDLTGATSADVRSATLDLYQTWSASCRPRAWEVWTLPAGTTVGPKLRWANQPQGDRLRATSTDTRGNAAACAPGWSSVDVTGLVQEWAAAGATSGTVMLKAADETDPLSWKRFASAETATVPHLSVTLG
ncbi:DNRLRE domain-containing protein [Pseudonocardia kujensis]|uniref:DNRLRE domain-containing protein n=1 Tax=Pseudonocardia kujensis TaxID=1128675 RepID=UPI001E473DB7|nr:DNRLRE domain-containing protein [Pseudonocardia kujensis]MCE0767932.1 DNRLRE domain-containing protein [Pseudonocardia kujensis]